jgi:outer membrane protein TolC
VLAAKVPIQVALEVRIAYVKLQNALESIPVLRQQAEASRQALRLASERYRERLGTLVELNEAQANLAEAAAGEVTGLYDVKAAESELRFALGRR